MKIAGFTVKRLTLSMAGIVVNLAACPDFSPDNFYRADLARLASGGYVNIVNGRANLSEAGEAILPAAERIVDAYEKTRGSEEWFA